jgi:hypothetical protein
MYLDLCAIKYVYLLLSSLVLASCSDSKVDDHNKVRLKNGNDGKATFNDLSYDMIRLIATFMKPKEIVTFRYVNCLTLDSFPLKKLVEKTFKIFGLESIADNEPELAGVMRFAHISHDPFILFKALMEDVVEGKKHYNALFIPLISHLFQTFSGLGLQEKNEYEEQYFERKFNNNVESYMINSCLMKDNFDLVLGIVRNNAGLTGKALECAAQLGHINVVEILLQSRTDTHADAVGRALRCAAKGGYISIVELILQSLTDIFTYEVSWALEGAASNGHTSIVEIIIQSRTDIPADHVGKALKAASEKGLTTIVELILQNRKDIPARYSGKVLREASKKGHTAIVELIIHHFKYIPAWYSGKSLVAASKQKHTAIVELILHHRKDIRVYHANRALRIAAKKRDTAIVEIILHHRKDNKANYAGINYQDHYSLSFLSSLSSSESSSSSESA